MSEAITDLQIRLTHQDDAIDALTHTSLLQQRQIDQLQRQVAELTSLLQALRATQAGTPEHEPPPPHY